MKIAIQLPPNIPFKQIEKLAQVVEQVGFSYIWVTDHATNQNAFVTLSFLSKVTDGRIGLGVGITNPYVHNPATIAAVTAGIDTLCHQKLILGIGAGDEFVLRSLGILRSNPLATIKEAVEVIKSLWQGDTVSWEGTRNSYLYTKLGFEPERRKIPIYLGAQNRRMLALSARIGEGVLINASHPSDYEVARKIIDSEFKNSTNNPKEFEICSYLPVFLLEGNEEPPLVLKRVVAFVVGSAGKEILDRHNIPDEDQKKIRRKLLRVQFDSAANLVTKRMIDSFAIVSNSIHEIESKFDELEKLGVSQIICAAPLGKDLPETIRKIGNSFFLEKGEF